MCLSFVIVFGAIIVLDVIGVVVGGGVIVVIVGVIVIATVIFVGDPREARDFPFYITWA